MKKLLILLALLPFRMKKLIVLLLFVPLGLGAQDIKKIGRSVNSRDRGRINQTITQVNSTVDSTTAHRTDINVLKTSDQEYKTNVSENTAFSLFEGVNAGIANTPGVFPEGQVNYFSGYRAGEKNTTGFSNTFISTNAGLENLTGDYNTIVGSNSGVDMGEGSQNTGVGAEVLQNEKYGGRNTSVGASSMEEHIVGAYNSAYGYQSQEMSVSAVRGTSYGYKSLRFNKLAFDNVAVGYKALELLDPTNGEITAYVDVGGGEVRVASAAHGQSNGATVQIQGTINFTDHAYSGNYDASYLISNVSTDSFDITAAYIADESVLITLGYWYIITEARNNVALGFNAGGLLETGSTNLLLGYNVSAPDVDGDYQLNIGDVITGQMDAAKSVVHDGSYNFGADAQADDDYEVTIPTITALTIGLQITFTANTANTDGATLEITSVGDLDGILKMHDQALATGDIESGQVVTVVFDGTNWQMTSQLAQ